MTYSIVARDAVSGELGVAVQSQAFNSGAAVAWARPGVGAVATQSFTDRRYGWRGLELLAAGAAPADALAELRAVDELVDFRQVAFLSADGRVAQWTGARCVPSAGGASGDGWAAQGNMLESPAVWEAMGEAFARSDGPLAERLMRALESAQAEGGDWRGCGGAGIVVVPATGEPWERVVDLRVEDGDDSLVQLRRHLERALAYRATNRATEGRAALGTQLGLPERHIRLLALEDAVADGRFDDADALLEALLAEDPRWLNTLVTVSALPGEEALARFLEQRPVSP
jgi:uncharacterized Ntn-hydrolase superfamily protein